MFIERSYSNTPFSYKQLSTVIEQTTQIANLESTTPKFWSSPGDTLDEYEMYFSAFVEKYPLTSFEKYRLNENNRQITGFMKERREKGLSCYAVDIAGGRGQALRDLAHQGLLEGGITTSLTDLRNAAQQQIDKDNNIHVITGDLLRASTWRGIKNAVTRLSPSTSADLVLCRPMGAIKPSQTEYELSPGSYPLLLKRMLGMLTINNGLLLTQVPMNIEDEVIKEHVKRLSEFPGLTVEYNRNLVYDVMHQDWFAYPFDKGILKIQKNAEVPFDIF